MALSVNLNAKKRKRTYSITASRKMSGLVLKERKEDCFVIQRCYEAARLK